ncbi:MAG: transposase, partial [Deltaproteobacteria bacterium]|nr:transposase [Deltaproteobacteria bacterium]
WPGGFVCPRCGANQAWRTKRWLWYCRNCGTQTSVTAGTIFHGTRKPLRLWFRTMQFVTGVSH